MVKADLHNHLRTSSRIYPEDFNKLINIALKRLGKNGIIGLASLEDKRYERFTNLKGYDRIDVGENKNAIYVPEKEILIVKGQEIPTNQGHLLVLGLEYEKYLKGYRTLEDTIKEVKDNNGIAIAVHPFGQSGGLGPYLNQNPDFLGELDAIEIFNGEACLDIPIKFGPFPYKANQIAKEFYEANERKYKNLGAVSCTDSHSFYEPGRSWTEINEIDIKNKSNFINSLRDSIRQTNLETKMQIKSGIIGALDHIIDLIVLKIAYKIGIKDN